MEVYGHPSRAPEDLGRKLAMRFEGQRPSGSKHYKEACAWYGALQLAGLLQDQRLLGALVTRYQSFLDTHAELLAARGHVDENVWGIVPLELYLQTGEDRYLTEGLAYADHQQSNIRAQIRYAIDDMFMITGLQIQAYRATEEAKYLDLAASTMVSYLDRLQQPDGTFFHREDVFIKWGRGNGWVASGLTELLRELPQTHSDYARVREGYEAMMQGLLQFQIDSGDGAGLWPQVLDYEGEDNWAETSGSAMFGYALIVGVKLGLLDADTYGPVARSAWLGLVGQLEADGRLRGVSDWMWDGTVADYVGREQVTGDNHGQAPLMWAVAALLRPL
jgi:rhamnogalacturonyl hydrolase YesR